MNFGFDSAAPVAAETATFARTITATFGRLVDPVQIALSTRPVGSEHRLVVVFPKGGEHESLRTFSAEHVDAIFDDIAACVMTQGFPFTSEGEDGRTVQEWRKVESNSVRFGLGNRGARQIV
jgi:hypothetical protein